MPSFCRQPGAFSSAQSLWGLVSDKCLDFLMGLVVHSPHRGVPSRRPARARINDDDDDDDDDNGCCGDAACTMMMMVVVMMIR